MAYRSAEASKGFESLKAGGSMEGIGRIMGTAILKSRTPTLRVNAGKIMELVQCV